MDNRALSGFSARLFINGIPGSAPLWPGIVESVHTGDWVFINLGINDGNSANTNAYSTPTEFQAYLQTMAQDVRGRGGQVLFLTRVPQRAFDSQGVLHVDRVYSNAMINAAAEVGVPYVDLNAALADRYRALGPDGSKSYGYLLADGVTWDTIHFNELGATQTAELISSEIRSSSDLTGLATLMVPEPVTGLPVVAGCMCVLAARRRQSRAE